MTAKALCPLRHTQFEEIFQYDDGDKNTIEQICRVFGLWICPEYP